VTPIPVPHQVKLAAYNAAGELVKIIYEGAAQYIPADLKLSVDTFLGGSGAVVITFPGAFASGGNTVSWGGYNDSAMLVQGGVYSIKAEITDPFGQVTALIKPVQVIPGGVQQTLRIYNGAGEMVRSINLPAPVAGATRLQTLGDAFALEIDPATGSALQPYKIDVLGNAGWTTASWDGLNDAGAPVSSGSYTLQLVSNEGGKSSVVTSRSVTVLKAAAGSEVLDSALLGPNPVLAGQPALLFYDPAGLAGRRAEALVYNLAGELIGWGGDPNLSGRIDLGLGKAQAGGVYLVRFQLRSGSVITQSRVLKLAIVH
jgi:flagellar hook assembly protein FlgD